MYCDLQWDQSILLNIILNPSLYSHPPTPTPYSQGPYLLLPPSIPPPSSNLGQRAWHAARNVMNLQRPPFQEQTLWPCVCSSIPLAGPRGTTLQRHHTSRFREVVSCRVEVEEVAGSGRKWCCIMSSGQCESLLWTPDSMCLCEIKRRLQQNMSLFDD